MFSWNVHEQFINMNLPLFVCIGLVYWIQSISAVTVRNTNYRSEYSYMRNYELNNGVETDNEIEQFDSNNSTTGRIFILFLHFYFCFFFHAALFFCVLLWWCLCRCWLVDIGFWSVSWIAYAFFGEKYFCLGLGS